MCLAEVDCTPTQFISSTHYRTSPHHATQEIKIWMEAKAGRTGADS